jgi:uncharacterized protein (DUF2384 family)
MNDQDARIEAVLQLAHAVFESRQAASQWMLLPNQALAGESPRKHSATERGAQEVRRVLVAIEWGGVV